MFDRIIPLIGSENFKKINNVNVLIIGIGGVGGIALESLVRCGFKNITIMDNDIFEESNLNRQILSDINSIGKNKVDVAKEKMKNINKDVNITSLNVFLDKTNMEIINDFDYVIDACDSTNTKFELYKYITDKNIKFISSLGMGNRFCINKLEITSLNRTINDPLAKKLRKMCKDNNVSTNISVLVSSELPKISKNIFSIFTVTNTAGIMLADYIINDLIKK